MRPLSMLVVAAATLGGCVSGPELPTTVVAWDYDYNGVIVTVRVENVTDAPRSPSCYAEGRDSDGGLEVADQLYFPEVIPAGAEFSRTSLVFDEAASIGNMGDVATVTVQCFG